MELRQREEVAENYAKQEMSWHRNQCTNHTRAETKGENILDVLYASETETDEGCMPSKYSSKFLSFQMNIMKMMNLDSSSGMPASKNAEKNTVFVMAVPAKAESMPVTKRMSSGMASMPPMKALASDLMGSFWYLSCR